MNKLKNLLFSCFLITSLFVSFETAALSNKELLSNQQVQNQIESMINATDLPMQIDEMTSLVNMKTMETRGLQYLYQLGVSKSDLGGERGVKMTIDMVRKQGISTFCNNPAMLWYKTNFVELMYTYYDRNEDKLADFRITPNDC